MIVEQSRALGICEFRLRPNRSLSPRGVLAFLAGMGLTMFAIAAFSARQGNVYAPVFALVHLALVAACFGMVQRRLAREERIALGRDAVTVIFSAAQGEVVAAQFHPYWVRLETDGADRLLLGSHGRRVEIGAFLGEDERADLARRLAGVLAALKDAG